MTNKDRRQCLGGHGKKTSETTKGGMGITGGGGQDIRLGLKAELGQMGGQILN
jgi:hypothetical protein